MAKRVKLENEDLKPVFWISAVITFLCIAGFWGIFFGVIHWIVSMADKPYF